MDKKILITGATGFVGTALTKKIVAGSGKIIALTRTQETNLPAQVQVSVLHPDGLLASNIPFEGVQAVIHCAARVHVMNELSSDPLAEFRSVNVKFTLDLARLAAASGVKRFVFISSVKVNGEGTAHGKPYRADDIPAPLDPYGISKMEAEQGLRRIAEETGIEIVIIRPVLIYGPGVKANFRAMMTWLSKGIPLPLGAIRNKRSLVSIDNLVDLVLTCLKHPAAANQTFMVSDGEDVSTTELLRRMGVALRKPARLIPVPGAVLGMAASVLGRKDLAQRLNGSLQVDISKTCDLLGWRPVMSLDEGLSRTADAFKAKSDHLDAARH
ncbi:NAD-dependent dehydratase [Pseudomonas prosekii]|uniref:NAD-dependent dehydratase n=1 Tax=Pseudomonas prosekii TaxID=1148509 RepID=A0A3L8D019_9PSED|nr:SDR family oxidoreductase [Pseudomonas prosekii]RLU05662.1 NAD-dependent dehydratase [Pseudomonas prosekii]RLU13670.1 NAD-dependent dehydratase [Pseudomonas prosekii]